jgi:hypothetical protein
MSIQQEMLEIRSYNNRMIDDKLSLQDRIFALNKQFDDWVFTKQSRTDKIDANRIGDLFGKPIEV